MKNFLIYIFKLLLPIFLVTSLFLILYTKADPYFDLKNYENYSWKYRFNQMGDLGTKKLLNSVYNYDSFIFGSSRSTSIYACYLESIIPESKFFHYVNFNETIGGIYRKLQLLDSLGYEIKNTLMYIDTDATFKGYGEVNFADHYLLRGGSRIGSYYKHFKSFMKLDKEKIKILLGKTPSNFYHPNYKSDPRTNDVNNLCTDSLLNKYGDSSMSYLYIKSIDSLKVSGEMYSRNFKKPVRHDNQISETEKEYLTEIKKILERHNTNYKVVITPLYDLKKFSMKDSILLKEFFGQKLYDYSGVNSITKNEYNYPDIKHFLPYVSKKIIDEIYND
ncbi:MAG: hypothetical protein VYD59_00055 [Bacteroidota bacterium]|nr:hypothetical protein [Bacteroidota bacterium]